MPKLMNKTYKKTKASKPKVVYVKKSSEEQKELNSSVTGAVNVGGYVIGLNNIGFGSDTGQRVGRAIQMMRLDYKFVILGASASGLIDYLRVMIVYDYQGNGVGCSPSDFLETGAGGNQVTMPKNTKSYPKRFRFLMDKIIPVQNQSTGGSCNGAQEDQAQSGSIMLSKLPITRYTSSAGATPASGAIVLCVTSYQNTGLVTTSAGLYGHFKLTYTDD